MAFLFGFTLILRLSLALTARTLGGGAIVKHFFGGFGNWRLYACFYLGGAIVVGLAMAELIEFPVIRLRDKFFPSRTGPLGTQEGDVGP